MNYFEIDTNILLEFEGVINDFEKYVNQFTITQPVIYIVIKDDKENNNEFKWSKEIVLRNGEKKKLQIIYSYHGEKSFETLLSNVSKKIKEKLMVS